MGWLVNGVVLLPVLSDITVDVRLPNGQPAALDEKHGGHVETAKDSSMQDQPDNNNEGGTKHLYLMVATIRKNGKNSDGRVLRCGVGLI